MPMLGKCLPVADPELSMRLKLTPAFVQKPPQAIIAIHLNTVRAEEPGREINEAPDRVVVWDSQDIGFGLMVTTGGHKSYVVQYRHGRRSRRMHLKNGLSLRAARKEAKGNSRGRRQGRRSARGASQGRDGRWRYLRSIFEEYFRVELGMKRDADRRS